MATNDSASDVPVDQQDGGPGSHTEDNSGGVENDVASGGVSDDNAGNGDRNSDERDEISATGARDDAGEVSDDADNAGG